MTFGKRIRHIRFLLGCTQKELAEAIGCQRDCVSQWENGRTCANFEQIESLHLRVGIRLEYLIVGRGEPGVLRLP